MIRAALPRLFVRVLVLLLVPVVIVATPQVATAAVKVSGATSANFTWDDGFMPGRWLSCKFQAFYKVTDVPDNSTGETLYLQTIGVNSGDCDTGTGFNVEGGSVSLTFNGQQPDGATCEASGSAFIDSPENETFPPFSASVTGLTPHPVDQLCEVTEYCWSVDVPNWGNDFNASGCEALSMGVPELPGTTVTGSCPWYTPTTVVRTVDGGTADTYRVTFSGGATPPSGVGIYAAFFFTDGTDTRGYWGLSTGMTYLDLSVSNGSKSVYAISLYRSTSGQNAIPMLMPAGIGNTSSQTGYRLVPPDGWKGATSRDHCLFWYGPKVWDGELPGMPDADVPAGDLTGTPPPGSTDPDPVLDPTPPTTPVEDEGCTQGFSIWNPATWGPAGFCEVVSALSTVARAIGSVGRAVAAVAGQMVTALGKALAGWFVPSFSFKAATGDFRDAYESSDAAAWAEAVTPPNVDAAGTASAAEVGALRMVEESGSGSTGCAGPGFTMPEAFEPLGLAGGGVIHPLSACEGITAELAEWTHLFATLGVVLMGLMKIVGLLLPAIGAAKQANIASSFDWGNDHVVRKY